MQTMKILGLSGSLRRDSYNRALLREAATQMPAGVELVVYEGIGELPIYDADIETPRPEPVERFAQAILEADGVLVATPEYNSSIPGGLKNAFDWASRPAGESVMTGKPAAVIGASTGMFGAVWAQAEARKVLGATGARVLERELPVAHAHKLVEEGRIKLEPAQLKALEEILEELAASIEERQEARAA
jgi:chromate reductase, NAD(P)H dehydrogenase (quinone)